MNIIKFDFSVEIVMLQVFIGSFFKVLWSYQPLLFDDLNVEEAQALLVSKLTVLDFNWFVYHISLANRQNKQYIISTSAQRCVGYVPFCTCQCALAAVSIRQMFMRPYINNHCYHC